MDTPIKTACNRCKRNTNHRVLHAVNIESEDYYEETTYMIIQCMGCDAVSYLTEERFTDKPEMAKQEWTSITRQYPNTMNEQEEFNLFDYEKYDQFPGKIRDLYIELETAFQAESLILAALGLRTLVEAVCIDQNMEGDNLAKKIKSLETNGLISRNDLPILDKLRELGNASAHQTKRFSSEKLGYALDVVNHALTSIYLLPKLNRKLQTKKSPRPRNRPTETN